MQSIPTTQIFISKIIDLFWTKESFLKSTAMEDTQQTLLLKDTWSFWEKNVESPYKSL